MRIGINVGGNALGAPSAPSAVVDEVRRAERDGFTAAWSVHFSRGYDALSALAVAGAGTEHIALGVGVVPTYPRHPLALAQQAASTQQLCGGRLTLGVGVSHRPVIEGLHGLTFASPAAAMREYLTVLGPLLRGEEVRFRGAHYGIDGGCAVPGTSPVPVVVGALSPRMVQVAGALADGVITWLAGPKTLAVTIVPTVHDAAAQHDRPAPRVIAGLPVAVTDDIGAGHAAAEACFARYAGMENYRRVFEREGVDAVAELAVVGDEAAVREQLQDYADAGVTELWPIAFPVGDADTDRTRALLADL